jgi:formate dehydrogenase major subunit
MNIELSRRTLLKGAGVGLAGTALGAFGFGGVEAAHASAIRAFKLTGATETRNTCP